MSEDSREHLSCLMDGEISRETGRFLVRRLGADADLCATWARYHLVRDCLRHQDGGLASNSLSTRVSQAIALEASPAAPRTRFPGWLKPLSGLAVAASVALMAIVAVGPGSQPEPGSDTLAESAPAPSFVSPQGLAPIPMTQQASLNGGMSDDRMNDYLLRHYQATGATVGRGFVTLVPIVMTPAAEPSLQPVAASDDLSEEEIVDESR